MMSESLQSAGSSSGEAAPKANDSDFVRATAEVRELREENSKMHQENLDLKVSLIQFFFVFYFNQLSRFLYLRSN